MLDWLYELLGTMLYGFSYIFGGKYVFGLLLYALLFKLLFLPFSIKQQKNQIKMAELTPKIELIKAKYKGRTDQVTMQKQQQEIMELQQKEGYNPMSGCLPLLIQMPIIIFLYNVIRRPLSYIAGVGSNVIEFFAGHWGISADNEIAIAGRIKNLQDLTNVQNAADFNAAVKAGIDPVELESVAASIPNFNLFSYKTEEFALCATHRANVSIFG